LMGKSWSGSRERLSTGAWTFAAVADCIAGHMFVRIHNGDIVASCSWTQHRCFTKKLPHPSTLDKNHGIYTI
jgi:hypothetical protein